MILGHSTYHECPMTIVDQWKKATKKGVKNAKSCNKSDYCKFQ